MFRSALVSIGLAFVVCTAAQGEVRLVQKFQEGSSFTVETSSRLEQKLTIAGTDVDTAGDTRTVTKATVGQRDAEGKLRVDDKTELLQISMTVMGQNYTFDSANPDATGASQLEMFRGVHKALAQRTSAKIFDKFDRITAVESDTRAVDGLSDQVKSIVQSEFDPEQIRVQVAEERNQITSDPVKPGDTWKRTRTANFGAGQLMSFESEYTYQGTEEQGGKTLDKITVKTLSVKFAFDNSQIPLKLTSSDLKAEDLANTILFDRARDMWST